jgi:hypothetical protein
MVLDGGKRTSTHRKNLEEFFDSTFGEKKGGKRKFEYKTRLSPFKSAVIIHNQTIRSRGSEWWMVKLEAEEFRGF